MELKCVEFPRAESLFNGFRHHISVRGVIHGYLDGRVFCDKDKTSAVLISPQGIFLGGDSRNEAFFREMNPVLRDDVIVNLEKSGKLDYVAFFPETPEFGKAVELAFANCYTMVDTRMTLSHNLTAVSLELPSDVFVVNGRLLESQTPGVEGVLEEISGAWKSNEDFLTRGFGVVAMKDNAVVGWCLTDWVVGDECEVGMETNPDYRRQGYGRKMANGFLAWAKLKGLKRVGWQCWSDNEGSIATAAAVGFRLITEYPVRFAWTNQLNNMLINGNHYMRGKKELNIEPDFVRSAWSYAQALDKEWDRGGKAYLYWNCACMFYLSGEKNRATYYYELALEKGWNGLQAHLDNPYVYKPSNCSDMLAYFRKQKE